MKNKVIAEEIAHRFDLTKDESVATAKEIMQYYTRVMRGEEKDQFGLDASLQDRTKCAELLGKRYGTFKEKVEVAGNIPAVITDDITE